MSGKSGKPPSDEIDVDLEDLAEPLTPVPASRHPTAKPPFDPDEYARESESMLRVAEASRSTHRPPPPLSSVPVRAVQGEDLEWFDLPDHLKQLYDVIDGESTLEAIAMRLDVPDGEAMTRLGRLMELGIADVRK